MFHCMWVFPFVDVEIVSYAMQDPVVAVGLLRDLTTSEEQPEPAVTLFLLQDILNRFNSTDNETQELLVEVVIINSYIAL